MKTNLHIAIDGPVASGKGTIAGKLAKRLGITYIYTGAMYRVLALACLRRGIDFFDEPNVVKLLKKTTISIEPVNEIDTSVCRLKLDGEDVTEQIITPQVAQGASDVSTLPEVRKLLVRQQQALAQNRSVVMEGRDIGLKVLPDAQLKIFLTASLEERARRRQQQFKHQGINKSLTEVLEETNIRDRQDTQRKFDPLTKLADAWELDTTDLTIDQVVEKIITELKKRQLI